ncbi:MAG: prepilin-type N-terminal cleavage/methylation domain-containing protein [Planctomycetes bacterium]|nr:prepilin-type N-terminal cleavage/methylation domain-containing protein [Planctomycetota bacterium]
MTSCRGNSLLRARGFTLAELLVVIALIALLGSLSAGAYQVARRNYSLQASAGRIQGVIRAARTSAILTWNASFVVVDPAARTVTAQAYERVGEWSFEDSGGGDAGSPAAGGASGIAVRREIASGATPVPGRLGKALSFGGAGAQVDCGSEARFDLRTGILIEAWVRHAISAPVKPSSAEREEAAREGSRRPRLAARKALQAAEPAAVIVRKQGAYGLGMTPEGALEGTVGSFVVRTEDGVVLPDRWVHVLLRFDGRRLELAADGVPRRCTVAGAPPGPAGSEPSPPPAAPVVPAPLTISAADRPFPGAIDEVRLAGATEPLAYAWAPHEHVLGWKKVIRFDRRGHLDPAHHAGPVRIVLVDLPDDPAMGPTTSLAVDYSVTFEEWAARFEKPGDLHQDVEETKVERAHAGARSVAIEVDRLGVVR